MKTHRVKFGWILTAAQIVSGALVVGGQSAEAAATIPITFIDGQIQMTLPSASYRVACGRSGTLEINGLDTTPRALCTQIVEIIVTVGDAHGTVADVVDVSGIVAAAVPNLVAFDYRNRGAMTYRGWSGTDRATGGAGSNLDGADGNDSLTVSSGVGASVLRGGLGSDYLYTGSDVTANAAGGGGDDRFDLHGRSVATGGDGNDAFFVVATQASTLDGGNGDDRFDGLAMMGGLIQVTGGPGFDRMVAPTRPGAAQPVKIRPRIEANGRESVTTTHDVYSPTHYGIEWIRARTGPAIGGVASVDVVMMKSIAVVLEAGGSVAGDKALLRVPGGVWTRDDANRVVTAPGLKPVKWVAAHEPGVPPLDLKIVAR